MTVLREMGLLLQGYLIKLLQGIEGWVIGSDQNIPRDWSDWILHPSWMLKVVVKYSFLQLFSHFSFSRTDPAFEIKEIIQYGTCQMCKAIYLTAEDPACELVPGYEDHPIRWCVHSESFVYGPDKFQLHDFNYFEQFLKMGIL